MKENFSCPVGRMGSYQGKGRGKMEYRGEPGKKEREGTREGGTCGGSFIQPR